MKVENNFKLIYSDTPVPDIFITEYLPSLTAEAVKLYIYSLLIAGRKRVINENDLEARMGTDKEGVKVILTELASFGLISFTNRGFIIEDIKDAEIKKMFKPITSIQPSDIKDGKIQDERNKMMADISKTFFSGLMSPSWYYEVESWFTKYKFDPQVVYSLFNECKMRKKLDSKAYISKVAQNWSENGVVTFDDLNRYSEQYDKVKVLSRKISQKMRKTITEYDEDIISKWANKMKYDFDVIDIALRKTSKLAHPNLKYADKLLEEWFSYGLKTSEEVKKYEEEKSAKFARRKKTSSPTSESGKNVGNFKQREYTDEYLEMMIDDLPTKKDD